MPILSIKSSPVAEPALTLKFRDLAREGQAIGLDLERGQAATPLADHFGALVEEQSRAPFTLALIATSAEARSDAVAWLLGEDHRVVSMRTSTLPGLVEIHLSERGYSLEDRNGQRLEFESLHGFLGALEGQETGASAESGAWHSLKVSLAAPPGTQGATLLLPESLQATGEIAGVGNALISRAQVLLVANSADAAPQAAELERIVHLTHGIGSLLPVVTSVDALRPVQTWWRDVPPQPGLLVLAPALLGASATTTPFAGPLDALHPNLVLATFARRLQLAIEALRERHEQDLRQAQSRRSREERSVRPESAVPDTALRRPFELAKTRMQEELVLLGKAAVESSRRSLLPDGGFAQALAEQLNALRSEDLQQDAGAKSIKLSLGAEFQTHLQRVLRKAMKEELARDLVTLRDGLDALKRDLEVQLEPACKNPVSLALSPPSESEVWSRLGELVAVEIRYRGEMPKRGFIQRLGEGRRMVFAVMMILSLIGSMVGFSWRGLGIIGIAFLLMFIGAVVYTYRAWKREDVEKLDAELDRVRDQLQMECKRVATEVQREKQIRLNDHLDQTKRALLLRLDDLLRERVQHEQEQQTEQRDRARSRMRKLDQQLKELQGNSGRVNKLRQDGANLVADLQRGLRELAQKLKLTVGA